jgi:hypothetical protein
MNRKVWLSRADACALIRARGLLEFLKTKLPLGKAQETAARVLSTDDFRSSVRKACFETDDATDHILLEVSADMYAVLRAMGLCGVKDSRGRQICIFSSARNAWDSWNQKDPMTLSILRVLLEQYGLIFNVSPLTTMQWDKKGAIEYASTLLGEWAATVRADIATFANAVNEANAGNDSTWPGLAKQLPGVACSLQKSLDAALQWRLETQGGVPDLSGFRSRAGCPSSEEKALHAPRMPNKECLRVVGEHARLFAARLAESAVMETLSLLKIRVAQAFAKQMCLAPQTQTTCDFKKMRLVWEEDPNGHWRYFGTLQKYCALVNPGPGVHLGLGGSTRWTGTDQGTIIQNDLTLKTAELSRLSPAHARERTVLSEEVLNIPSDRSNKNFDLIYANSLKRWAPAPQRDHCAADVKANEGMLRALALLWSARKETPKYPSPLSGVLARHMKPPEAALNACTVSVPGFKADLQKVVNALNDFVKKYNYKSTNLHRRIVLVLTEGGQVWEIPLTMEKSESVGIYDFVVWMICHQRALSAPKLELTGVFLLNGQIVEASKTAVRLHHK